jgi:hypothetical protein
MATGIDLPARTSSLTRSKMTMFASAATPIVRIRPRCRAAARHRDELDQREQVGRVEAERQRRDDADTR